MMRHIVTTLLLLGIAGVTQAQQAVFRYKVNQPYKYLIENKSDQITEYAGQTYNSTTESTISFSLSAEKELEDGNVSMKLTIGSALVTVEAQQGNQTFGNGLSGKSMEFTLGRNGRVLDLDTVMKNMEDEEAMIFSSMMFLFPRLDQNKLRVNESWKINEPDTIKTAAGDLVATNMSTYTVKGTKSVQNRNCLEISMEGKRKLSGKSARMGQDFNVMGETNRKATILYDPAEGILVELRMEESGDQAISDPNNASMKINIMSSGNGTVELVP